ncbi:hypothetical protein K458DRAFT_451998 [Lentithecium fluviatile CBS 122367]|uniref:Aminoglycoside phosphotransferase domain-containing protein n=1 Tax=Lentithecium fluviatile CBS 122367 TaxID=1168545 RepID=A0A6G1J1X3_9PLEO|nr:hypothetical protein K458DRAFT_451998 [Lentithecium fluviatile CBS 122367]
MQRVPGEDLESVWPTLTNDDKATVCAKLKAGIDYLRSIPSQGFYGGVGATKRSYHLFWDPQGSRDICGPFQNSDEFNAALAKKLRKIYAGTRVCIDAKARFYEKHLGTMLGVSAPVFSHSDLQRKNILIDKVGDSVEVAIIDWETAGWYPSYWEYAIEFCSLQWIDDWPQCFEQILEPWPREAVAMRVLYQDLWF